jgi:hypothetical protein
MGQPQTHLLPSRCRFRRDCHLSRALVSQDVMRRAIPDHAPDAITRTRKSFCGGEKLQLFRQSSRPDVSCPATTPRRRAIDLDDEDDDDYDDYDEMMIEIPHGDKFFAIRSSTKRDRYLIKPRTPVQEDFCGALLVISLPKSRESLLRVLERLDKIFLATGRHK